MPDVVRRRSERSRVAILTAARELLTESGYTELTVEAIAARAGVGKQTIYRWWPGKGAVILDALVEATTETSLPNTGDLRADLTTVLRAIVAELADPRLSATTRALTIETLSSETLAVEMRDRLLRPQLEAIKDRLRAAPLHPGTDLDLAVELLIGPPYHRWLLRTGPLTNAYADSIVDSFLSASTP